MIQLLLTTLMSFALNNVNLLPTEIYTPLGFDTNDKNVQLAFDSYYPDACYQYMPTTVSVSETEKKIFIDNNAHYSSDMACAKVIRYFDDIVNLGPITAEGNYSIMFKNRSGAYVSQGSVMIKKPDNEGNVDDIEYAPVQELNIVRATTTTLARLFIRTNSTCVKIKSVKTVLQDNVMLILPEIEAIEENNCGISSEPITLVHDVSLDGMSGKFLLHIRAMNGKAISRFVEL